MGRLPITVVSTTLGRLTLVRDEDALRGLYYPNHWYSPDPRTFGPRRDVGFADAVGEYLAGRRKEFDVEPAPRGSEFQHRVWEVPYGETVSYGQPARHLGAGGDGTAGRRRRPIARDRWTRLAATPRGPTSRATATVIPHGHGLVLTTRDRPATSIRGWLPAPVRHGGSVIRFGSGGFTLGLVVHDAAWWTRWGDA